MPWKERELREEIAKLKREDGNDIAVLCAVNACAAPAFSGDRLRASIRMLMIASAVLALAGLSGVAVGDMQLRMIGVVGYACLFPRRVESPPLGC